MQSLSSQVQREGHWARVRVESGGWGSLGKTGVLLTPADISRWEGIGGPPQSISLPAQRGEGGIEWGGAGGEWTMAGEGMDGEEGRDGPEIISRQALWNNPIYPRSLPTHSTHWRNQSGPSPQLIQAPSRRPRQPPPAGPAHIPSPEAQLERAIEGIIGSTSHLPSGPPRARPAPIQKPSPPHKSPVATAE